MCREKTARVQMCSKKKATYTEMCQKKVDGNTKKNPELLCNMEVSKQTRKKDKEKREERVGDVRRQGTCIVRGELTTRATFPHPNSQHAEKEFTAFSPALLS